MKEGEPRQIKPKSTTPESRIPRDETPPEDPLLRQVWEAYGPDTSILDNPIPDIVARITPLEECTPEAQEEAWRRTYEHFRQSRRGEQDPKPPQE